MALSTLEARKNCPMTKDALQQLIVNTQGTTPEMGAPNNGQQANATKNTIDANAETIANAPRDPSGDDATNEDPTTTNPKNQNNGTNGDGNEAASELEVPNKRKEMMVEMETKKIERGKGRGTIE